jgi:hypothetical protein
VKNPLDPLVLLKLGELKNDVARVLRSHKHVYVMEKDSDDLYMASMEVDIWQINDDKQAFSFKVGDSFEAKIVNNNYGGSVFVKFRSARISISDFSDIITEETEKGKNVIMKKDGKILLLAGRDEPITASLKTELMNVVKPHVKWKRDGSMAFGR